MRPEIIGISKRFPNSLIKKQILALEDEANPLPLNLFNQRELKQIKQMGNKEYTQYLKGLLIEDYGGD